MSVMMPPPFGGLPPLHADMQRLRSIIPSSGTAIYFRVEASVEARERILLSRIAELEADAERYRWLRDKSPGHWTLQVGDLPLFKGDVDAAIDAARSKE